MVPTRIRRLGAISTALFLASGLALLGCDADLDREDGSLRLVIGDVGSAVDALAVAVGVPELGAARAFELPVTSTTVTHVVGSVPVGTAEVAVQGLSGGRLVASALGVVSIEADRQAELRLSLGDGTEPEPVVESGALDVVLGPLEPDLQGTLEAQAQIPAAAWSGFQRLAAGRVEADEVEITVTAASVALLVDRSEEAEKLQDLWREDLELRVAGGAVGRLGLGEDKTEAVFVLDAPDVSQRVDLAGSAPTVGLSGEAKREVGESKVGYVQVTLRLRARGD